MQQQSTDDCVSHERVDSYSKQFLVQTTFFNLLISTQSLPTVWGSHRMQKQNSTESVMQTNASHFLNDQDDRWTEKACFMYLF